MRLLGPVFWYDLTRIARRQRMTAWRITYALLLLAAILLLYLDRFPTAGLLTGGRVSGPQMQNFADAFFAAFVAVQFIVVILITPALAANAVAEERSRNTLLFLFTTHLNNREIVAGKLLTRLLQIGLLVLTGLPVLALMQLFGGIDPNLMLSAFAAVALTGLSLGCVGLTCGIRAKKPQNAAWRAYQCLLLYAALSSLMIWYFELPFGRGTTFRLVGSSTRFGNRWVPVMVFSPPMAPAWWQTAVEAFNAGNPYFAFLRLQYEQARGTSFGPALAATCRDFAIFHGIVAVLFGGYAVLRLRAIAAAQTAGIKPTKRKYLKAASHPPILDRPMLWKEIYCEAKPRQRWLALFFSRWFFFVSFLPAWIVFLFVLDNGFTKLASYTTLFLEVAGTLVACLLCLRVGMQAARSIASERERETLDSLLTTSLTPGEIILGKWWGAFLNCRWILLWLLVHWGLGVLALAITWYSVPVLVVETLVFAAVAVSVGMLCAVCARTSKQAVSLALLLLIVGTTLAPWIGAKFLDLTLGVSSAREVRLNSWPAPYTPQWTRLQPPWTDQVAIAFSPPRALANSVVQSEYHFNYWYSDSGNGQFAPLAPYLALSVLLYLGLAIALALLAAARFRSQLRIGRKGSRQRLLLAELVSVPESSMAAPS